jgi:hypothetical protein
LQTGSAGSGYTRAAGVPKKFAATAAVAGFLALVSPAGAADFALPLTGNLLGRVADSNGNPQMGARIELFNRYQRSVAQTVSSPDGRFAFASLPIDLYSIRISLASFLPAFRDRIAVKAGLDSVLQIHLATLFSNVDLSYVTPTAAMTNDWKWALRAAPATRPITRYLPAQAPATAELHPRIFSGTHALLSLSGGDTGLVDSGPAQRGMGTGFAVSTTLPGKNQLQLAGSYGQNGSFSPAAMGFCAIYSRSPDGGFGNPPEVTLTVSQVNRFGGTLVGGSSLTGSAPVLRTMSLSVYEAADFLDNLHLEYGITGESVDYLQHSDRISPFGRLTADLGSGGSLIAAYSDGGRPDELTAHQRLRTMENNISADLTGPLDALTRLPQVSRRGGQLELQRTQNYELGYNKTSGSLTYAMSAFYERVSNGRINLAGDVTSLDPDDLLFDGLSKTSTYNVGRYARTGYLASVDQRVNDSLDVALAYGRMGGFTSGGGQTQLIEMSGHNIASVNVSTRSRLTGTRLTTTYGWMDSNAIIPRHFFTTQSAYVLPGFNVSIRQPLPAMFGMPGRFEVIADLRNLLAQGYLPMGGDAHKLLIVEAPRIIRGGVNFTF